MEIKEILEIVLNVSKEKKFKVYFHGKDGFIEVKKEMSYLELGMYLVNKDNDIQEIHIYHE